MSKTYFTTSEVAKELSISPDYVRKLLIRNGKEASYRTPGGQRRFSADEI